MLGVKIVREREVRLFADKSKWRRFGVRFKREVVENVVVGILFLGEVVERRFDERFRSIREVNIFTRRRLGLG